VLKTSPPRAPIGADSVEERDGPPRPPPVFTRALWGTETLTRGLTRGGAGFDAFCETKHGHALICEWIYIFSYNRQPCVRFGALRRPEGLYIYIYVCVCVCIYIYTYIHIYIRSKGRGAPLNNIDYPRPNPERRRFRRFLWNQTRTCTYMWVNTYIFYNRYLRVRFGARRLPGGWPVSLFKPLQEIVSLQSCIVESIILLLPPLHLQRLPYCNTIVRPLRNIHPATDSSFLCHTPYNIDDGNIV